MGNFFVYLNDLDFIFKIWILFLIPWSDKGVSVYKPSFVFPMIQEIGKKKHYFHESQQNHHTVYKTFR